MTSSIISYFRSDILQHLTKIFRLENFQEKDIQRLLRISEIRKYRRGQLISEEGKTNGYIYYLISGCVQVEINENLIQVFNHTGAHFGEMSVLNAKHNLSSVTALEDSVCVAISLKGLEGLAETDSYPFKYIMFRKIAEDLASKLKSTIDELIESRNEISRLKQKY
jgi:CRP/FNR family transcriptional regulator, cyclic AMP receptor protein